MSEDEGRLIAAFVLQRLKTGRIELDLTSHERLKFEQSR
jgi:hypothetical protein